MVLCSLLFTAISALAQNPAPKSTVPALGAPTPGTPTPSAPADGARAGLNFRDAPLADVLAHYEKLAKVTLIIPAGIRESGMKITVTTKAGSPEQQLKILDMVLNINGIYIMPTEDKTIMKVTGVAINPKGGSVPFINDEKLLPKDEQLVLFSLDLNYQDATEVAEIIAGGKIVPCSYGNVASLIPLRETNSLLITDSTAATRKLVRILREADGGPVNVVSKFFTLANAQADDVVTKLNARLAAPVRLPQPPPETFLNDARDAGTPPASSPKDFSDEDRKLIANLRGENRPGKVKLTADKRINRVHVVAREHTMNIIATLIQEYDATANAGAKLPPPPPAATPSRH